MYKQEKIKPYGGDGEKGELIERLFNNIASTYDTLNHRLSWNIDKVWRKAAIKQLVPFKPKYILDIATGTGDLAILAARMLHPAKIVGADIAESMMAIGNEKVREAGLKDVISFKREDCMSMSFEDESFDAVTAAFGIRNFQCLDKGLSEMYRVLKSNGHLCIAELTTPISFPMRQLFRLYSNHILPAYASLISKDKAAYEYLTKSIEAFPQGEDMMKILKNAGFKEAAFKRYTFGTCTIYFASK